MAPLQVPESGIPVTRLATFRCKSGAFERRGSAEGGLAIDSRVNLGLSFRRVRKTGRSRASCSGQGISDAHQVIGNHTQADPTLDPVEPAISGAAQSMTPFEDADPALTTSAPPLGLFEPTPPL